MTLLDEPWTKTYPDKAARHTAHANHQWLSEQVAAAGNAFEMPRIQAAGPCHITFDYVLGRHARLPDLGNLAAKLGHLHRVAHENSLHAARLDVPFDSGQLVLPGFVGPRHDRIRTLLSSGRVPGAAMDATQALALLDACDEMPATFYKDANLRNILVTGRRATLVDFDCLTLAPFGYDLAKLIISLAMTYGRIAPSVIADALASYNHAITGPSRDLPPVTWRQLMDWAEINHILTSRYIGENGYRHGWHQARPASILSGTEDYYLGIARAVSLNGDCIRSQVGAVIVSATQAIVAAGSNRSGSGQSCLSGHCTRCLNLAVPPGEQYEGCIETHAERNAVAVAGTACKDGTIYLTHTPCITCLSAIKQSGLCLAIWPGGRWARSAKQPDQHRPADHTNTVTMVTSNTAKVATAREHLAAFGIVVKHVTMHLDEIQSASLEEIALHKARQAFTALGVPVITEDGGFFMDELGGFPGPLAKPATTLLGLDGIIRLADLTQNRSAHFESALAYTDSQNSQLFISRGPAGHIASHPADHTRDGAWSQLWDIWIPAGADQPLSGLSDSHFSQYQAVWRKYSVFTQLGSWVQNAGEYSAQSHPRAGYPALDGDA
jgi:non-canonical purine NTP pyrophosphatase (RdgB/HAM1 family)